MFKAGFYIPLNKASAILNFGKIILKTTTQKQILEFLYQYHTLVVCGTELLSSHQCWLLGREKKNNCVSYSTFTGNLVNKINFQVLAGLFFCNMIHHVLRPTQNFQVIYGLTLLSVKKGMEEVQY